MEQAVQLITVITVAALAAGLAGRLGLSSPLVLTVVGIALSFVPLESVEIELDSEVVLFGVLPPLLYATAIRTPWVDISRNRRSVGLLSVGLVIATALAVAGVTMLVLPELPFGLALALGAVVAPPDAVAASAVARRVGMPRRVVTLLEAESLLNDATALVLLRTALATLGGAVSLLEVGVDFLIAVLGGVGVGWVLAMLATLLHKHVTDPVLDTSISLITPFAAFLVAEELHLPGSESHGSGVLAVVVAGLILGHRALRTRSAASRVIERTIWRTVQFLLESVVFLLIGLQLRSLLEDANAAAEDNWRIAVLCLAVFVTAVVVRILWMFPGAYLPRLSARVRAAEPDGPTVPEVALMSWAGMRGVVTLAAVFTIPADAQSRETLVIAAFAVVIGTLLMQGPTLPWLVRRTGAVGPDPAQDALQQAQVQLAAAKAGLARLEETTTDDDPQDVVESLHGWGKRVSNAAWERLAQEDARETPSEAFLRLRVQMLAAERDVVADLRSDGKVPQEIAAPVLDRLDQEEAMLAGFVDGTRRRTGTQLEVTRPAPCDHLAEAGDPAPPESPPDACPDCVAEGVRDWVHLRMCVACGHVACCDSSPRRHASAHHAGSRHPVMQSVELGESWRWCYVDQELG